MIFLIDYDPKTGKLKDFRQYPKVERSRAEDERLRIELSDKAAVISGAREVVLLEADDEKTLRRTHRRYFDSARDIVASMMMNSDT
jgi:hypothetical protein